MIYAIQDTYPPHAVAAHRSRMTAVTPAHSGVTAANPDRADAPGGPPPPPASKPGQESASPFAGKSRPSVLVAEDNFANQLIAKTLLMRAGYEVTTVDDGFQAADICKTHAFDLILMDIEMPEMSGIEATEEIRKPGSMNAGTMIVALTAYGSASQRWVYRHSGINHVLAKPFKIAQLESLLGRAPAPQPAPPPQDTDDTPLLDEQTITPLSEAAGIDGLRVVIKSYWRSAYALLSDMQDAQQVFDRDRLQKSAHALKGASINIGLPALARLAARLQNAKIETAPDLLDTLESLMAQSRKALSVRLGL